MIGRKFTADDLKPKELKVMVKAHILEDLQTMVENSKLPVEVLVDKALLMFIATHSDYLGRRHSGGFTPATSG